MGRQHSTPPPMPLTLSPQNWAAARVGRIARSPRSLRHEGTAAATSTTTARSPASRGSYTQAFKSVARNSIRWQQQGRY